MQDHIIKLWHKSQVLVLIHQALSIGKHFGTQEKHWKRLKT